MVEFTIANLPHNNVCIYLQGDREEFIKRSLEVEDDYVWMTKQLMEIANQYCEGKIVSCLEGGYNLSALGRSVAAHLKTLAEI